MKALAIFSGGLDSMLAASVVRGLGIDVLALFFESPFFTAQRAKKSAAHIRLPLKVIDITHPHLEVVKQPKHGHGKHMNPCIDCHALMFKTAGDMLESEGAGFIISGEVLGQRPMSQNREALLVVAAESGYEGLIVRPLSAKCLPMTIPEERGWIRRDGLLDFSGRSRKPQMALANQMGITQYPSPAGGCLLTDQIFSKRLKDLLTSDPAPRIREIELLKLGRHFRVGPGTKLVVGKNKRENEQILSLAGDRDRVLNTTAVPGPTVLLTGRVSPDLEEMAADITASYSDSVTGQTTDIRIGGHGADRMMQVRVRDKREFRHLMIT